MRGDISEPGWQGPLFRLDDSEIFECRPAMAAIRLINILTVLKGEGFRGNGAISRSRFNGGPVAVHHE